GISRDDYLLFSESQGRFVVTVPPDCRAAFEAMMEGLPFSQVGRVTEAGRFLVTGLGGGVVIDRPVSSLREAWLKPLAF
ncbi:MAG: hypothetical protein DRG33_07725, partial [Deltaproteobacteria bacterium]